MTSTTLSAEQLVALRFFEGESPDAIEWLIDRCPIIELQAQEVLFTPKDQNDALFVILSGGIEIKLNLKDVEPMALLGQGDCVGELSVLEGSHTTAYAVASEPCELLKIDQATLFTLINRSHATARNLIYILISRLRNNTETLSESIEQQRLQTYRAQVDALTGLYNRRWLDETLERLIERAHIDHHPLTVVLCDVDHFKRYNDSYGHLAGDNALVSVAATLQAHLRPSDDAARYGGEEFVILLPDTPIDEGEAIAQRLCDEIRTTDISDDHGKPLPHVTISMGLAAWQNGQDSKALLEQADAALYRAKSGGRDRVSL